MFISICTVLQGQLEQEEGAGEGTEKKADVLRLSLTSLKEEDLEEDPLKTNRALAALLESDRRPETTPIGVEEVRHFSLKIVAIVPIKIFLTLYLIQKFFNLLQT